MLKTQAVLGLEAVLPLGNSGHLGFPMLVLWGRFVHSNHHLPAVLSDMLASKGCYCSPFDKYGRVGHRHAPMLPCV
jgi:hypothetical protein